MKTNQTPEPTTPEWDRARNLRDRMRTGSRNRLAAKILLGKVTQELKEEHGIEGRGGDRRSKGQRDPLKSSAPTWKELCERELTISRKTSDRYIACFQMAIRLFGDKDSPVFRILRKPSADMTDEDFDIVAANVDELVDKVTQANLRIELGITQEEDDGDDGAASVEPETPTKNASGAVRREAGVFFRAISRDAKDLNESIGSKANHSNYANYLHALPPDDGKDGHASLRAIKEELEEVHRTGLGKIIQDIAMAMEGRFPKGTKLPPPVAKAGKKKIPTKIRK